jgi:hypothetical protein
MTIAVATPHPVTPIAGRPSEGAPDTSSADSGTFSARPASCSAITAFGRDTAVLKPR